MDWRSGFTTIRGWDHTDPRPFRFSKHAIERFELRIGRPPTGQGEIERDFFASQKVTYESLIARGFTLSKESDREFFLDELGDCWVVVKDPTAKVRIITTFVTPYKVTGTSGQAADILDHIFQGMDRLPTTIEEAEAVIRAFEAGQGGRFAAATVSPSDDDARQRGRREQERRLQLIRERWELERDRRLREQERQERRAQREPKPEPSAPSLPISAIRESTDRNFLGLTPRATRELVDEWRASGRTRIALLQGFPLEVGEWYAASPDQKAYWRERAIDAIAKIVVPPDTRPPFKLVKDDPELMALVREAFVKAGWRVKDRIGGGFLLMPTDGEDFPEEDDILHRSMNWRAINFPAALSRDQLMFLLAAAAIGEDAVYAEAPQYNRQIIKKWLENKEFRRAFKAMQNMPPDIQEFMARLYHDRELQDHYYSRYFEKSKPGRQDDNGEANPNLLLWVGAAIVGILVLSELARRRSQQQAAIGYPPVVQGFWAG